ncbi:MAG TPA: ATP-binding protein, partial [Streptosporangiaceae bacterium]|nr:ATP-binding protein [Streptosporangiaceae bacterium]
HVGRKTNELAHPLTVLEDAGLITRETDAFRANRTDFRINEPLLGFYHTMMRPYWPQLMRATDTARIWERSRPRFAGNILGPHFEKICRDWALYFAGDRFGDWPTQVTAGTVNDPANKTTHQVDVAILGHADGAQPPLLAIGEAKWNDTMGLGHLERLRHIRSLVEQNAKFDTTHTRLVCFSGTGFTDELQQCAARGEVDLVSLDELYGSAT